MPSASVITSRMSARSRIRFASRTQVTMNPSRCADAQADGDSTAVEVQAGEMSPDSSENADVVKDADRRSGRLVEQAVGACELLVTPTDVTGTRSLDEVDTPAALLHLTRPLSSRASGRCCSSLVAVHRSLGCHPTITRSTRGFSTSLGSTTSAGPDACTTDWPTANACTCTANRTECSKIRLYTLAVTLRASSGSRQH